MLRIMLLAAAWLVAAPAVAQSFYVGGHFGQATVDDACEGLSNCEDSDTAWRILGGFQFNPNFAVEVAYTDFGEVSGEGTVLGFSATATIEATALEVVAVGMLPLADRFSVYGKAGMYSADVDAHVRVSSLGSASADESNTGLTFGAGVSFSLAQNLSLRGEWQRYQEVGGDDTGEADIDVLSVGLLFRF